MKFCSECGSAVKIQSVDGDNKPRFYCSQCGFVHYQNPKVLVSCYATWQDKILWMKRNTEPLKGLWSAPSGFLEENEDLMTAAARELYEETRAEIIQDQMQLHMVGNLLSMNQIYIVYRAPLVKPVFSATDEASEVKLFSQDDFPYDEFAYPEVVDNVRLIYRDLQKGEFGVYTGVLEGNTNKVRTVTPRD